MTIIDWILTFMAVAIFVILQGFIWLLFRMREDEIEILSRNSERPAPIERSK